MSSTLLEVTRASHQEVERFERLILKYLQNEPTTHKDRLYQSHRVRHMIDTITATTEKLIEIYEDKDGARTGEIAALGGTDVFSAFYDRLKEIREYHRNYPAARVLDADEEFEALEPQIEFSGEEAMGRYLDMHELYNQYTNSKFGEPIEYTVYLDTFDKISRKLKFSRHYLEKLLEYLVYFFERTEPLQDLDRIFSKVENDFEERCGGQENGQHPVIDLDYYSTSDELIEVGPERLKEALAALGLKSGGTVQQRAERLFLTNDTPLDKLDKKHFAKGSEQNNGSKEIALLEAKIMRLCSLLEDTIERTKENVEKKQALTYEEMEAEREEEDSQAETESDDEDQQIYNPLKLPMGWDGKPIPYWAIQAPRSWTGIQV